MLADIFFAKFTDSLCWLLFCFCSEVISVEPFIRARSIATNKYVSDINTQAMFIAIGSVMWCSRFCHRHAHPLHLAFPFL